MVAVIASGPSAKSADIDALRGRAKVIAIKANVDLCPWADLVYGCDAHWWRHRRGLPEFKGLKVRWGGDWGGGFPDVRTIEIEKTTDRLLFGKTGVLGSGGNSGFQAVNLALQFGARRILLIGFDYTDRSGVHWYGRNTWPMANNPVQSNFNRWLATFDAAKGTLVEIGAEVVNASPISAMHTFPRRSIADALKAWGQ